MTWIRRWSERAERRATTDLQDDEVARLHRLVRSLETTCELQQEQIKSLAHKLQMNEDFLRVVGGFTSPTSTRSSR